METIDTDKLRLEIIQMSIDKWSPKEFVKIKTVLKTKGYDGNELESIPDDRCDQLIELMENKMHILKNNTYDYSFLCEVLHAAQLPKRAAEVQKKVEGFLGKHQGIIRVADVTNHQVVPSTLPLNGRTSADSSTSSGSVFSPTGNSTQRQIGVTGDLELSAKLRGILRDDLDEKYVKQMIGELRNSFPESSNYGAGAVKDVDTPYDLYNHMKRRGDIRERKSRHGDVTYDILIQAVRAIKQEALACKLEDTIQQHQASMKSSTASSPMSSNGSVRSISTGSTPMTPNSVTKSEAGPEADFLGCLWSKTSDTNSSKRPAEEDIDWYNLSYNKGLVAVINNYVDTPEVKSKQLLKIQTPRYGTVEDENAIVRLFSEGRFATHYELFEYKVANSSDYTNQKNRDLDNKAMNGYLDKLKEHLKNNKDKYSSFILFIMSHGDKEGVTPYPASGETQAAIPVDDIMKRFEDVLHNKPKVIVIQACKGNVHNKTLQADNFGQSGVVGDVQTDRIHSPSIPPPKGADMLVACSTIDGYYSYRDGVTGSLYIQSLLTQIGENYKANGSKHLVDFLTKVHADVSRGKHNVEGIEGKKKVTHKDCRQMPYYQSSLCSNFFLLPLSDDSKKRKV